jgi:hypothetical protein
VAADPGEERDLSGDPAFRGRLTVGRRHLEELKHGQVILEMNRIWDPSLSRPR